MITIDQIIKEISNRTEIDQEIVDSVCKHVFKFTADKMKDKENYHDILFNGLFKFKLKNKFKNG